MDPRAFYPVVGDGGSCYTQRVRLRRKSPPLSAAERRAVRERKELRTSAVVFPLGPYHPALPEPFALRLRLRNERVVSASALDSGYGRRGLLDLVVGQPLVDALVVLERACAHAGQAYRLALSIAVERAARITTPRAAQLMRVFFAELEMTQSALRALAELARALSLPALYARGLEQRERIYEATTAATGERVYWGIARPGGVRADIRLAAARVILDWLPDVIESWRVATAPKGSLRRAADRVDAQGTQPLAASAGAVGRLSAEDARRTAPYDGYRAITLDWSSLEDGRVTAADLVSRSLALVARLKLSGDIMRVCAETLGDLAPELATAPLKAGQGSVTVQTAHGPARLEVTLTGDQRIAQLRLATTCATAQTDAPVWLVGRRLAHVPAILASLDLCPSCADL